MTDDHTESAKSISQENADLRLTEAIKSRFEADDMINHAKISVSAEDGVVTLEGTVTDQWSKDRIEAAASELDGVAKIDSRIAIRRILHDGQS